MSGKGKGQLGYGERETIERLIMRKESISGIGRAIGRSPSTVEREIKRNGTDSPAGKLAVTTRSICVHQNACAQVDLCGKGCLTPCRKCKDFLCNRLCPEFEAVPCPLLEKPPYCCNGCIELYGYGCTHPYHFYDAKAAHEKATDRKVASRMGIDCTPEELAATTAIVKKGLAQGQSIRHIFAANEGKMCCSWRTYYDYVEDGLIEDVSTSICRGRSGTGSARRAGGRSAASPERLSWAARTTTSRSSPSSRGCDHVLGGLLLEEEHELEVGAPEQDREDRLFVHALAPHDAVHLHRRQP